MTILHNYCLVKPDDADKISSGGIIMPDNADKEKPVRGTVIQVGDECQKFWDTDKYFSTISESSRLKEGDVILFKRYAPYEIDIDGEKRLLVAEPDILAIL